ncbi:penicillin-binding protein, partial [Candidatus Falkowbacteria bacterium]
MPIPQLKQNKNNQSWRNNKKKYYVTRNNKKKSTLNLKNKKSKTDYRFKGQKKKKIGEIKKKLAYTAGIIILAGILVGLIFYAWLLRDIADISKLTDRQLVESTKIFDRTGEELLYEIHGDIKRTEVKLNEIPDYIKWATIAMEDKNFYKHKGISLWAIFRGVVVETIRSGRAQGGSTLTQQFVKNAILTPERKIVRKFKEWILSYRIEKQFTKDEILEMYLNEIPYGSTSYGVEAASERYFGKNIQDISLAEAALLAALPQAPSRYSPYGPNRDLLIGRQQYILDLMVEQDYITQEDADVAKAYEFEFKPPETNIKAPHFVMYVKEILSEKYGEKMIEQGGLKIYTTLDLYKQEIAEEVIREQAEKNEKNYEATNAALVSIDPKTGQILAMVGSRDYFDDEIDGQVNITTSKRQPGSSLKPVVYATAFMKGYTPDTILYDVVTNFSNNETEPYEPHNYDDQEHGPVTVRKALAGSLNIPAVKAIYLAGVDSVLDVTGALGYTTLNDRDRFGLSLVLGGGEVKLLEHTNAYGAFAREGILYPISAILKIEDKEGKLLEEFKAEEKKALDPKIARLINNILSDNGARAYAFGASNWLTLGSRPVAAKTGTTNDYRDAWTIGYTPSIVTGVWV